MCRYAFKTYKSHFACFHCRKAFKIHWDDLPEHIRLEDRGKCPQCDRPMANMGLNFKAPKQKDIKQWNSVRILFENGIAFHDCGCGGSGPSRADMQDVHAFIESKKRPSNGEKLLEKFIKRTKG